MMTELYSELISRRKKGDGAKQPGKMMLIPLFKYGRDFEIDNLATPNVLEPKA